MCACYCPDDLHHLLCAPSVVILGLAIGAAHLSALATGLRAL